MNKEELSLRSVLWFENADVLNTFTKMWYHVFLWALFSSIFVHTVSKFRYIWRFSNPQFMYFRLQEL